MIAARSRMNWDTQLSAFLSSTDGSVAKMKERLTSTGKLSRGREDLFPVREAVAGSSLDPAPLPLPPRAQQPSSSLGPGVHWTDLTAVQSQVQIQSQVIESLTQKLHDIDIERQSQQRLIQILQEEVHRLREESKERQREEERSRQCPEAERQMERWRQEVGRELSSLRGQISRATSLGNPEESFSSKLRREELEQLRREVDQLKTRLRRQEEDVFLQQTEGRDSRRQYERSCKMLEELTDGYRTHSLDMAKAVSQYTHIQQEVHLIRATVSELKDEVRSLVLRDAHQPTPVISQRTSAMVPAADPVPVPSSHNRGVRVREAEPDSDSEDFSPTPSLADVSSDDLSWLDDDDLDIDVPHVRLSTKSRQSGIAGPGSDLDDDDGGDEDDDDDLLDDEGNQELGADLSLNDL